MNRQIDFNRFKRIAKQQGISVHLLIKRNLVYRKSKGKNNCKNCAYSNKVKYPALPNREALQCFWIGQSLDFYSDVKDDHVCDYYKYSYEKGVSDDTKL